MDSLRDKLLLDKKGNELIGSEVLTSAKLVAFIFSDDESTNVRELLGKLKDVHEECMKRNLKLVLICVPLSSTEEEMINHFSQYHGSWYTLAFGDRIISELIYKYDVIRKPTVVVVRADDEAVVSYNADLEVMDIGINVLVTWFGYN